jgi:phosphoserine phosphatase
MNPKKSVALFDIDKTIYNQQSFFSVTKYLIDRGLLSADIWPKIEEELGKYNQKIQNYSYTANVLLNLFGNALVGKNSEDILNACKDYFMQNKSSFYSYFTDLLPVLKQTHDVYLVTTNSQMVARSITDIFDLDGYLCTNLEVVDGKFTGVILNSLADGKHIVSDLLSKYTANSIAFGDSENDIGMLEQVTVPVCINPTPELLVHAQEKGWTVVSDTDAYEKVIGLIRP